MPQDSFPDSMRVVDSHTEGEPTRVIVAGWPELSEASLAERRQGLLERWDHLRQAVVCEPRGHDAVVGALLTPPASQGSAAGVVFFNNRGYLGMCGHGLIGLVRTLQHLQARDRAPSYVGRLGPGPVRIDTPVGTVAALLEGGDLVTVENVPARLHTRDLEVEVPGVGRVSGDVAWGGNWFFLTSSPGEPIALRNLERLLQVSGRIRSALAESGIAGTGGDEIDHVELFGPAQRPDADSRNFVLCPGGAYDRSPCGTGTSAKLAALHARGKLELEQRWRQESVTGGLFTGWLTRDERGLIPHIQGRAFVTGETTLLFDPGDPLRAGFGSEVSR